MRTIFITVSLMLVLAMMALARDLFRPLVKKISPMVEVVLCLNDTCMPEVKYNGAILEEGEASEGVKLIKKERGDIILLVNGVICSIKVEDRI